MGPGAGGPGRAGVGPGGGAEGAPPGTGRVVVVGLGPGAAGLMSEAALDALRRVPVRFVRTLRHPGTEQIAWTASFDDLYAGAGSMGQVYDGIVSRVLAAAAEHGEVLYAVPGSPLVAERTVELLRERAGSRVEIVPSVSFLDLAWARLGVDPVAVGARLVDGHRFATEVAGSAGPFLVAQCDRALVLSELKLAVEDGSGEVVVLQRLGLPSELVRAVAWADLDRVVEPDHLTCVWVPRLAAPVAAETARLVELMAELRERCPWDRSQTHHSLRRHLLEESYEVLDALGDLPAGDEGRTLVDDAGGRVEVLDAGGDGWEHLCEELGDLLFQIVFHARLASEVGQFGFADVVRGIHDKLVARHPHVFGAEPDRPLGGLDVAWEQRKAEEKGRTSVTEGIPADLPALALADKLQRRAGLLGLGPDGQPDAVRLEGLAASAGDEEAVGELLFELVAAARSVGVDAETALRVAARRFAEAVRSVEAEARALGLEEPGPAGTGLAGVDPAVRAALWAEATRQVAQPHQQLD